MFVDMVERWVRNHLKLTWLDTALEKGGDWENKKLFKRFAMLQNQENGHKIHNFRATAKLLTYYWGST